jgi:flagellar hook-associated protein 1 FlgK
MPGTFFGLETALRSLRTHQMAMDVTNHNVANANTPGYSRQVPHISTTDPYTVPGLGRPLQAGQLGTGSQVSAVQRSRDPFLDGRYRSELAGMHQAGASLAGLQAIESVFNEPSDHGLSSAMAGFFSSWQDLASDPSDSAARLVVVRRSTELAAGFRRVSQELGALRQDLNEQVSQSVQQVNSLAGQIATLNQQIVKNEFGGQNANDLRDQRDMLLDQLAELVPITTTTNANGSVNVLIGGRALVQGYTVDSLVAVPGAGGMYDVRYASDSALVSLTSGEIQGLITVRDQKLPDYLTRLDQIASGIITAANALHSAGYALDGSTGRPLFIGTNAATIAVDAAVAGDPRLLAAASAPGQVGNNTVALAIAQLRRTMSPTPEGAYGDLISAIGTDAQASQNLLVAQTSLVDFIERQRQSVSGVSLDEEAANLIRYQRAYEAAARVVTTIDEMLDTLINRTGIVGR